MASKPVWYLIDFEEEIKAFEKALSYQELPNVDIDVALGIVAGAFEEDDFPYAVEKLSKQLARDGWLLENEAWVSAEEEEVMKEHIQTAIRNVAMKMHRWMLHNGFFPTGKETYSYKRNINDYTLAFTRLS